MANDGFIEFLSPNALAELKKASEIVDALALKIEKISNFKAPTTPGGVNSASKQIIDDLKAQEAQLKAINDQLIREEKLKQQVLATEAKQSNATKANIAQREAQRKASLAQQQADDKVAKAAERSALANQRLNDAYGKLNRSRNEAARVLQNLIASETASNREIQKAQREFDILNGKVKKADQAVGNFSRNVGNYGSALSGVTQLMSAFGIATGLALAVDIAKSIFNTTKELQSLDMALRNVSGTQLIYQENMNFLSKVSEDFGIEIKGLQEQFTQFYVAAKDKLSADQIRDIFKSISKAGAAMGLSVDAQKSAFLALQQMMSKGTVQAEELKKQLGNALPGAFNIMATALGVTEKKMMEMMKAGNILSEVALPKFAIALEKAYGIENVERIDTIISAQERLANSWTNFIRQISEGDGIISKLTQGSFKVLAFQFEYLTAKLKLFNFAFNEAFSTDSDKTQKSKAVKNAISDYEEMQSALKKVNIERDKEIVRLNRLEKIAEKVTGSDKTKAEFQISLSEDKIRLLDINIAKETKLLEINKVDTVKKLNEEIDALKNRNAEISLYSLEAIRNRDKLVPQSEGWLDLNKYIKDNNKIVEENTTKLKYNETLRELILRKDKVRTPPELDTETGTKKIKPQKEKIALNFKEAESEYNLKLAILERRKAENIDDDQTSYEDRIAKRIEFSKTSIEIIDMQLQKEYALIEFKRNEDNKKNDLALKNKEISLIQHTTNKEDITNTFINKNWTAETKASQEILALQKQDFGFFKMIKHKQQDAVLKLNKIITDGEIAKYKSISDNENYTLIVREAAFQTYIQLEKDLLKAQKDADIARAKSRGASKEEIASMVAEYENAIAALGRIKSPKILAIEEINAQMQQFAQSFADNAGFSATFKLLQEGLGKYGDNWKAMTVVIMESMQEMFNFISQASQENFDEQYERLEKEKQVALAFAGDSEYAKAEIERQAETRRKEIQRREFKAKKDMAAFNIAIDTAQAIVSIWAQVPKYDYGVSAGLLSALVGALGVAQIAMVQSQPMPQFFKGTDNAPEGMAWTQEKGREIITDKHGKIKSTGSDKGAQLTYLSKGDKVFTAEKSALMFNENLNSILTNNGISGAKVEVNTSGISDEQINKIVSSINNKKEYHQTFDRNGINNYISDGHTKKQILNNQVTFGR